VIGARRIGGGVVVMQTPAIGRQSGGENDAKFGQIGSGAAERSTDLLRPPLRPGVERSDGVAEGSAKCGERVILTLTADEASLRELS
jgi:hypothetical protein